MTKAHYIALFGWGCAANSLLSWLAALHPNAYTLGKAVYGLLAILLLAGVCFDDAVYPVLDMSQTTYYGLLGVIFLTMVLGSGLIWLAQ